MLFQLRMSLLIQWRQKLSTFFRDTYTKEKKLQLETAEGTFHILCNKKEKTLCDTQQFIDNVQGNPKSVECVSFYTGFYPNTSEYFHLTL